MSAAVPVFIKVTVWPAEVTPSRVVGKLSDVGRSDTAGAPAIPVPDRVEECGEPAAESVMVTEADLAPVAVGANLTAIEQLAPAARVAPQVLDWVNCVVSAPVSAIDEIVSVPDPVFDSVRFCADEIDPVIWLPKAADDGVRDTIGASPVPVRDAAWGEPGALSVTVTAAVREPVALGLKVIPKMHDADAASVAPHPLVRLKSAALAPPSAMDEMLTVAVPGFATVIDWLAEVVPVFVPV